MNNNILLLSLLCFLLTIGAYGIIIYNSIIRDKNSVEEGLSSIYTAFQLRYDLIPHLIEIVKQYMIHEKSIIEAITKTRTELLSTKNQGSQEYFLHENSLQKSIKSLFALSENYPELKSSHNFLELQTEWAQTENRIQASRRAYNSALTQLKNKQEMFPTNIIANMMNIKKYEFFEVESEAKNKIDAKKIFNS